MAKPNFTQSQVRASYHLLTKEEADLVLRMRLLPDEVRMTVHHLVDLSADSAKAGSRNGGNVVPLGR